MSNQSDIWAVVLLLSLIRLEHAETSKNLFESSCHALNMQKKDLSKKKKQLFFGSVAYIFTSIS